MIPRTYPTLIDGRKAGYMRVFYLTSVTGLTKWIDYIPVKTVAFSAAAEGTTNANGHINVVQVASSTALRRWVDYIPVFEDGAATVPWSTNANGYIPVDQMLDLDFRAGILDSRITFTRADASTCATYFDSTGRLQTALRNELTYSEDLSNAAWSTTGVTKGTAVITEDTATSGHLLARFTTWPSGVLATGAFVVSAGTATKCWIGNASAATAACFDLSTGTVEGLIGSITATITALGSGRYLIAAQHTAAAAQTLALGIYSTFVSGNYNSTISYLGTGRTLNVFSGGLFLGGYTAAQVQAAGGIALTTTAANSGPRFDYDPASPAGVTGPELVTNGDFSQGTTGWSVIGTGGSIAVVNGELEISATAGNFPGARKAVTTETGKRYLATLTARRGTTASSVGLNVSGLWPGQVNSTSNTTNTQLSVYFTAQGTSTNIDLSISSGTANGTAYFDDLSVKEVTFNPRGLLIEESRQNLLLQSRDMTQAAWTKTDVTPARTQVGIDGTANSACLITEGSAGTAQTVQSPVAVTAGSTITGSIVLKRGNTDWVRVVVADSSGTDGANAWFNLNTGTKGSVTTRGAGTSNSSTITSLGGGWYRCALTTLPNGVYTAGQIFVCSATADTSSTRVSGATYIVDCAQLEVGAFATSIIPTTTTALTRAADSASMTGTNFSSWFNQTAGSFVVEGDILQTPTVASRYFALAGTAVLDGMMSTGRIWQAKVNTTFPTTGVAIAVGATFKGAVAYDGTGNSVVLNGGTPAGDASVPSGNTSMSIGSVGGAGNFANSHIRSLRFYPQRLPQATLQALTA